MADPVIRRDVSGDVTISVPESSAAIRYTTDGSEPGADSPVYAGPFALPRGGTVKARAFDAAQADRQSAIVTASFGLAKGGWTILSPSTPSASSAIDENEATFLTIPAGEPLEVVIDLGERQSITALTVTPRQDGKHEGIPAAYAVSVSDTAQFDAPPIAMGEFSNIRSSPNPRTIKFSEPQTARYVRFSATRIVDEGDTLTLAEIGVMAG